MTLLNRFIRYLPFIASIFSILFSKTITAREIAKSEFDRAQKNKAVMGDINLECITAASNSPPSKSITSTFAQLMDKNLKEEVKDNRQIYISNMPDLLLNGNPQINVHVSNQDKKNYYVSVAAQGEERMVVANYKENTGSTVFTNDYVKSGDTENDRTLCVRPGAIKFFTHNDNTVKAQICTDQPDISPECNPRSSSFRWGSSRDEL